MLESHFCAECYTVLLASLERKGLTCLNPTGRFEIAFADKLVMLKLYCNPGAETRNLLQQHSVNETMEEVRLVSPSAHPDTFLPNPTLMASALPVKKDILKRRLQYRVYLLSKQLNNWSRRA